MSAELDYSPPNGTQYLWGPKTLNYSPWVCRLADRLYPAHHWPMDVTLSVDLHEGAYKWRVQVRGWRAGETTVLTGAAESALAACLEAERVGGQEYEKLMPAWVVKALDEGWRPPC